MWNVHPHVTKLDPKSLKCVFLGYSHVQKGCRCFYPELGKYLVWADVTSFEISHSLFLHHLSTKKDDDDGLVYHITCRPSADVASPRPMPFIRQVYEWQHALLASCPTPNLSSSLNPNTFNLDLLIAIRKGKRQYAYPISTFVSTNKLSYKSHSFMASLDSVTILKTVNKALSHPRWCQATVEEINALNANGT